MSSFQGRTDLGRNVERGFTLLEMLVVITIISILAGFSLMGVLKARRSGEESAAKAEVQMLRSRIDALKNAFGYYPPTSLAELKVKTNGINDGNESLFGFLLSRKRGGPFADDLAENRWSNADGDSLAAPDLKRIQTELNWVRGTPDLLEYVDFWGNPFVYIHSRDYAKKYKCQNPAGEIFDVEARKNPVTGTYAAPTSYQLWSLGADGLNQNGEGDDIASWK
jgi:prepilin-type N-terminal cleavage/methylation domain-containing protein